jgi:hypothetical protein
VWEITTAYSPDPFMPESPRYPSVLLDAESIACPFSIQQFPGIFLFILALNHNYTIKEIAFSVPSDSLRAICENRQGKEQQKKKSKTTRKERK